MIDVLATSILTLDDVKAILRLEGTTEDDNLTLALNAATRRAEKLTRRILTSQDYFRRLDGHRLSYEPTTGESRFYCPQWPVTAVARCAFDVSGIETDQTVWLALPSAPDPGSPSDFDVMVRGDLDDLTSANSYLTFAANVATQFPCGVASIILEYTAGYNDDNDEFPAPDDLKNAVAFLTADEFYRRYRAQWNTVPLEMQGQALEIPTAQLFSLAASWLAPYARPMWG